MNVEYHVHVGRPSWQQDRAGALSAGIVTFTNLSDAKAYRKVVQARDANEIVFILKKARP